MNQLSKHHFLALSLLVLGACAAEANDPTEDPDDLAADSTLPDEPDEGLADPPPATAAQVLTPTGLVDHGCVQEIGDGETVDDDGVVTREDGTTYALPACSGDTMPVRAQVEHPIGTDTTRGAALAGTTPTVNGWMEAAWWDAPHWQKKLHGHFIVPDAPSNKGDQTVFFFPSFEPKAGDRIVQPVLQWGPSAAGGGKYWAIASWYVGPKHTVHSKLRKVRAGDKLYGSISGASCSAKGHCSWTIVTKDLTHKKSTTAKVKSGAAYTQVQGGVLEAYRIDHCNQLPAGGGVISFFDLGIVNGSNNKSNPDFKNFFWDHSCHESIVAGDKIVFLNWD